MKNVSLTFDTVAEMLNDTTITSGMSVECLGYNKFNDGSGGTYRIFSKLETETEITPEDITLISDDTLFARKIDTAGVDGNVQTLIKAIDNVNKEVIGITNDINEINSTIETIKDNSQTALGKVNILETTVEDLSTSVNERFEELEDEITTGGDPFEDVNVFDFNELCGIEIHRAKNGSKSIIVDHFSAVDDTDKSRLNIEDVTPDMTQVIMDGEVTTPAENITYIDPNLVEYVLRGNVLIPTYYSAAIDSVNEDLTRVIIDGEEVTPAKFVFYCTAIDDIYVTEGVNLYKVLIVDEFKLDENKVVIDETDVEPEKDNVYMDNYGNTYLFDGLSLYKVTMIANTLYDDTMYSLYRYSYEPKIGVTYRVASNNTEYEFDGNKLNTITRKYYLKVEGVSEDLTKIVVGGEEVTPYYEDSPDLIYVDTSNENKMYKYDIENSILVEYNESGEG